MHGQKLLRMVKTLKSARAQIMSRILADELNLDEKLVGLDALYTPTFEHGKILLKAGREDINKSKGAKVILGYYTAVLEYSLKFGSYNPKLLLLDTPRQEELDMSVFSKLLNYWNALSHYNKVFQIIITGSEFPLNAGRIIAEFHNRQASGDYSSLINFQFILSNCSDRQIPYAIILKVTSMVWPKL